MYQKVTIIGNLGADPELKYTQGGTEMTTMRIATNEEWKDREGNRQKRTTWWRVTVFGKQAVVVEKYLAKGRQVMVEGTVQPDENGNPRIWTGNDGVARASFEMRADRVVFLGGRSEGNGGGYGASESYGGYDDVSPRNEEEIPF